MYVLLKKLLWTRLSVKFIMATNNLLVCSDRSITKLAGTICSLGCKALAIRWQALHFIYFLSSWTPARYVHVRREMDVCIWSPTRSAPHAGDIDDVLRWTTGLFLPRTQTKRLIPISLNLLIPMASNPRTTKPSCRDSSLHGWHTPPEQMKPQM